MPVAFAGFADSDRAGLALEARFAAFAALGPLDGAALREADFDVPCGAFDFGARRADFGATRDFDARRADFGATRDFGDDFALGELDAVFADFAATA